MVAPSPSRNGEPDVAQTVIGPARRREQSGLHQKQEGAAIADALSSKEVAGDNNAKMFEVIRWFGERGKIFNAHFRNIKGRKLDFMEAFPDEGDMDMPRSLAAYRDVGYPYMLMPDHVPQIDGRDPPGGAFAYCSATSRRSKTRWCRERVRQAA